VISALVNVKYAVWLVVLILMEPGATSETIVTVLAAAGVPNVQSSPSAYVVRSPVQFAVVVS